MKRKCHLAGFNFRIFQKHALYKLLGTQTWVPELLNRLTNPKACPANMAYKLCWVARKIGLEHVFRQDDVYATIRKHPLWKENAGRLEKQFYLTCGEIVENRKKTKEARAKEAMFKNRKLVSNNVVIVRKKREA